MSNGPPPCVIKKVKKVVHGHHGGAWKVAFADFTTAMMALFLLMWILGTASEEQLQAISGYFEDPTGARTAIGTGGPGSAGTSPSLIDFGGGALPQVSPSAPETDAEVDEEEGDGESSRHHPSNGEALDPAAARLAAEVAERARLEELREQIQEAIQVTPSLALVKDQILLEMTSEGLRLQIVDRERRPMFAKGGAAPHTYVRELLREIVPVVGQVENRISIVGHTDATPYSTSEGYSNWELSTDRANAARRELVAGGLEPERIGRVMGLGSSVLHDASDPYSPVNRRISITVMTRATDEAYLRREGPVQDAAAQDD